MQVSSDGAELTLTAKQLAPLELLISALRRLFSRERILSSVCGSRGDPLNEVMDVDIGHLRAKIDRRRQVSLIQTKRG